MAESLAAQSVADSRVPRVAPGTSFSFSMTVSGSDDDGVPLGVRHLRKRRRLLLSVTAASAPVEEGGGSHRA